MLLANGTRVEFRPNVRSLGGPAGVFCFRCRKPVPWLSGVVANLTTWQGQHSTQVLDDDCAFSYYGYRRSETVERIIESASAAEALAVAMNSTRHLPAPPERGGPERLFNAQVDVRLFLTIQLALPATDDDDAEAKVERYINAEAGNRQILAACAQALTQQEDTDTTAVQRTIEWVMDCNEEDNEPFPLRID